mmetsp:Transcript_577/g.700  ORF Transcript_577/g.700 Transcript_577/m.700 type:complete len:104 (+) Transcript_577:461-772(+)
MLITKIVLMMPHTGLGCTQIHLTGGGGKEEDAKELIIRVTFDKIVNGLPKFQGVSQLTAQILRSERAVDQHVRLVDFSSLMSLLNGKIVISPSCMRHYYFLSF